MTSRFIIIMSCFVYYVYGERNYSEPRIISEQRVDKRSLFAYQVSIRIHNNHFCGGTIINEQHILTAAHCCYNHHQVREVEYLEIYAGDLRLHQPLPTTQVRAVKYIFTHPDYNSNRNNAANDIALIRLKKCFTFNSHVKALNLASKTPLAGETCIVSGWGVTYQDWKKPSEGLNFVSVPILEKNVCKRLYPNDIKPGMFCAGYLAGEIDACLGDSGGPLASNGTTLVGIVSWGMDCAQPNQPGVYTDVAHYLKWIESVKLRSSSSNKLGSILIIIYTTLISMLNYFYFIFITN